MRLPNLFSHTSSGGRWKEELVGMRSIISNLAQIPLNEITGIRAPFLQTSGTPTFRVLHENGFTYDSSMPTRLYTDPPTWPYTLDHGFKQECTIPPCPTGFYPGLWEVPLVGWLLGRHHCAMLDACALAADSGEKDYLEFMKSNFLRHYKSNRAPFPVFLHESWLHDPRRKAAYFQFVDWLLEKDDVFLVTVKEVIDYVKKPLSLKEYRAQIREFLPKENNCDFPDMCEFNKGPVGSGARYMVVCGQCPDNYPWLGNPTGM